MGLAYAHLPWTTKPAVASEKLQAQIQKISKTLNEQYFEKHSILTLCLNDWISKYKNSPGYSQPIKMEEQHILAHTSYLLLYFFYFYNILTIFSLHSCHYDKSTPTEVSKRYSTQAFHMYHQIKKKFPSAHTCRNTNTLQSFAFIYSIQEALTRPALVPESIPDTKRKAVWNLYALLKAWVESKSKHY